MMLIKHLARRNHFRAAKDNPAGGVSPRIMNGSVQISKINTLISLDKETSYSEHVAFLNFKDYNHTQPIYINLVRDPLERLISWFFYIRGAHKNAIFFNAHPDKPSRSPAWFKKDFNECVRTSDPECRYEQFVSNDFQKDFRRQSLFFCGHNKGCLPFNSPAAIQTAKMHVDRHYAVVGSWEDTNVTLSVLEHFIPRYFSGARELFDLNHHAIVNQNKNTRKPTIYKDVREMIKRNLTQEYDFYYFCKQRLYRQYISLNLQNMELNSLSSYMLNNTVHASNNVLFFNRVAKVGSESMMELLTYLGKFHGYHVAKDPISKNPRILPPEEERSKAKLISDLDDQTAYIEHLNFINFTQYDLATPIYINLVRDPVDRVISWYFYIRGAHKNAAYLNKFPNSEIKSEEWFKKDFNKCVRTGDPECVFEQHTIKDTQGDYRRQSLFFCGNQQNCLPFNSPWAIQIAKKNVEKYYAVVGSWEDTNITLTVLEKFIPRFFQGAKLIFEINHHKITNQNKNTRKPKIDQDVREIIRKNFTQEYDFYHFCKQRLYKQYISLNLKSLGVDFLTK